ncbi:class I SAM-dependent methyltransferase [Saccharopolyspora sp. 5N708]|uniref:class I SAM-dependent methyltransferase n=1 Tax=Saccharopolyspora sp. 5N708 TaxID=3457424 RepID=UPI003FD32FE6
MTAPWDERAGRPGLHSVLSSRWTDDQCAAVDREQKDLIARMVPGLAEGAVLDLGCGVGRLTAWAAGQAPWTLGVDQSPVMIRRARAAVAGLPGWAAVAGTDRLPVADGSFRTVLAVFTLQHVVDDERFARSVREIGRAVAPGGDVLVVDGCAPDGASRDVSSSSTSTVVRPLSAFTALAEVADRIAVEGVDYVGDRYLAQLWRAR